MTVPKSLNLELERHLGQPGQRLRKIRASGSHGYPAILDGELDWTDDPADPNRLLFTTTTGHPVRHTLFYGRTYRPAVRKLWPEGHSLNWLRWHDLRHTCASLSLAATGSLFVVMQRLGHDDIKTTINRYGHLTPSVDAALADALGEMFDATADSLCRDDRVRRASA